MTGGCGEWETTAQNIQTLQINVFLSRGIYAMGGPSHNIQIYNILYILVGSNSIVGL